MKTEARIEELLESTKSAWTPGDIEINAVIKALEWVLDKQTPPPDPL